LPAEHHRWAMDELKWLAGALAPARNWDVFLDSLVKPVERALPLEADLKHLAEAAEQRRRAAHESAREVIQSPRYSAATLKLARWFEARGWREQPASEEAARLFAGIGDIAPGLIDRRWRQARKRSKRFDELSQDERHKLRIALKKLRYTTDFLESLFEERRVKSLAKRLRPLQEDLGHLNDIRTAHTLVEEVAAEAQQHGSEIGRARGIILGWYDRGLADQEPKLRKHVRRLRQAKPFWPRPHLAKPRQDEASAQHHEEAATRGETPAAEPDAAHAAPEAG